MRHVALLLALVGCSPVNWGDGDDGWDHGFDGLDGLDNLFGGPVKGAYNVAQFTFADGCPGDGAFGCPQQLPPLAVGARLRLNVSAVNYDKDNDQVARSTPRVQGTALKASRDDSGVLVIDAVEAGTANIELFDGDTLVDVLGINAWPIANLAAAADSNVVLAGARIGARVKATDSSSTVLYARGAVSATASGALAIDPDQSGFFASSDQAVVSGTAPGAAIVTFAAGDVMVDVPYTVVTRESISRIEVVEWGNNQTAATNKLRLWANAFVDDQTVRGGPACGWRIADGGGAAASLADRAADDTTFGLQPDWTGAIVYGNGTTVVECRATKRVAGQLSVSLAP